MAKILKANILNIKTVNTPVKIADNGEKSPRDVDELIFGFNFHKHSTK